MFIWFLSHLAVWECNRLGLQFSRFRLDAVHVIHRCIANVGSWSLLNGRIFSERDNYRNSSPESIAPRWTPKVVGYGLWEEICAQNFGLGSLKRLYWGLLWVAATGTLQRPLIKNTVGRISLCTTAVCARSLTSKFGLYSLLVIIISQTSRHRNIWLTETGRPGSLPVVINLFDGLTWQSLIIIYAASSEAVLKAVCPFHGTRAIHVCMSVSRTDQMFIRWFIPTHSHTYLEFPWIRRPYSTCDSGWLIIDPIHIRALNVIWPRFIT